MDPLGPTYSMKRYKSNLFGRDNECGVHLRFLLLPFRKFDGAHSMYCSSPREVRIGIPMVSVVAMMMITPCGLLLLV